MTITTKKSANGKISGYYVDGVKVRKNEIDGIINSRRDEIITVGYYDGQEFGMLTGLALNQLKVVFTRDDDQIIMTEAAADELGYRVIKNFTGNYYGACLVEKIEATEANPEDYAITPEAMDAAVKAETELANMKAKNSRKHYSINAPWAECDDPIKFNHVEIRTNPENGELSISSYFECKNLETAYRRFRKIMAQACRENPELEGWDEWEPANKLTVCTGGYENENGDLVLFNSGSGSYCLQVDINEDLFYIYGKFPKAIEVANKEAVALEEYAISPEAMDIAVEAETELANAEPTIREKFLAAKEEIHCVSGRYLGNNKFAQKWERKVLLTWRAISKEHAAFMLQQYYGLTIKTYLAEREKWVAEEISRGAAQMAIEDLAVAETTEAKAVNFATELAELQANVNVTQAALLKAQDNHENATKALNSFLDNTAMTLKNKLDAVKLNYPITLVTKRGASFRISDFNDVYVDAQICDHAGFCIRNWNGKPFAWYDTPAQIEKVIALLQSATDHGDTEFTFPTTDELNDPNFQVRGSLERAMGIALNHYKDFCHVKNLTAAEYELSLYDICRKALKEVA